MSKLSRLLLLLIVLFALAVPLLVPGTAYAIADPDGAITVSGVYIYTDCLEDGDIGVFVDYNIPYATLPSEGADSSFFVDFIDVDGTTIVESVAPYNYILDPYYGYNRGYAWIYITAAHVAAHSLDPANIASHHVWVIGNPTAGWTGAAPKVSASIDYWQTSGITDTLLSVRVVQSASVLTPLWSIAMTQDTPIGTKLSTYGEGYFCGVISNLRQIAPSAFADATIGQTDMDLDYTTSFGATMTDGTGTVVGSPITLVSGSQSVNVTVVGSFTFELNVGTTGTMTNGTGTVTGSPVALVAGTNTVNVTGIGTFTVVVQLVNSQTRTDTGATGSMFDMSALATVFGIPKMWFAGMVWLIVSVLVCAAVYKVSDQTSMITGGMGAGKITLLVFDVCIIGGALLGMLSYLIAALMFLSYTVFIGYVIFYRNANV